MSAIAQKLLFSLVFLLKRARMIISLNLHIFQRSAVSVQCSNEATYYWQLGELPPFVEAAFSSNLMRGFSPRAYS